MTKPSDPLAHQLMRQAVGHHQAGQLAQARELYQRVLTRQPDQPDALHLLGTITHQLGNNQEAIALIERAITLAPAKADYHVNAAAAYRAMGEPDQAIAHCFQALRLEPNLPEAHNNLGGNYKDLGLMDEALAHYRRAYALNPRYRQAHSNALLALYYLPHIAPAAILREHAAWTAQHAAGVAAPLSWANDRSPQRRLRIGYVSPDLWQHPVGRFLLPLFTHHDHDRFEVIGYCDSSRADHVTADLQRCADAWYPVAALPDVLLAERITANRIDILVDLALHSARNRMLVFARKPAPLQFTYLGYPGTTGLSTIDYRITDPYLDPPGLHEQHYSERCMPISSYFCYQPPPHAPDVGSLPAQTSGHVTFGCLNNPCKLSSAALELWRDVLRSVPASRLLLHAHPGSHRQRLASFFNQSGISADRIDFLGMQPFGTYLGTYQRIDIALDPLPYPGATTTCDALYMGVPVVTLAGDIAAHRAGASILANVGLHELIAQTPRQYLQITQSLANDLARLAELRCALRARMLSSRLCDAPAFTRDLEAVYREAWRRWCAA